MMFFQNACQIINEIITVKSEIKDAPQKVVIPKENRHNSAFSFGITTFCGASFISDFTAFCQFELATFCPIWINFIANILCSILNFFCSIRNIFCSWFPASNKNKNNNQNNNKASFRTFEHSSWSTKQIHYLYPKNQFQNTCIL